MSQLLSTLLTGIISFVATNIDDIVILMIFFSQVNASFRPRHIVLGQYLGLIAIILLSLPGFLGGLFLPETWIGLLGFLPLAIGIRQLLNSEDETVQTVTCKLDDPPRKSGLGKLLTNLLVPQVYHVAAVTLANGGDNVAIYVPLFASSTPVELLILICTFLAMVVVWCSIARYLALHPAVAPILTRYGQAIVPFVLIGLGLYILIDSGSYQLLAQLFR